MATVQELLVKITGDASNFSKAIKETQNAGASVGQAFEKVGGKITSIGTTATAALSVPIVGAATVAVNKFAEVDKTMALTNKTMGNTESEANLLNKAMKDAAANSTFGMNDAATASLNFARAGLSAKQAASTLAPAMNLAAGEGGNLDTVSAGLVATINGFHGSFNDAGKYADVFASACNNSALDVDSLSNAMSIAAPIFSSAGYSVNDAALYMGIMANNGIDANKAATSLKTGLARLVSPAKDGIIAMNQLGISVTNADGSMKDSVTIQKELHEAFSKLSESEQIAAASAIFGKNQMAPWLALINTAPEDVDNLNLSLDECAGTTNEMAEAMMSGFGGSLEKLKSSIDVAATSLGEALAPAISKVATQIQGAVDWFNSLDTSQQQSIATMGLMVAAIGPMLIVVGKMVTSFGSLVTVGSKIGAVFSTVGTALTGTGAAAGTASAGLSAVATIAGTVIGVLALVAAAVYSMTASFGGVKGLLTEIQKHVENVVNGVKNTIEKLGISGKIDKLKSKISELLGSLGNMKSFWEIVFTVLEKVATVIGSVLVAGFGALCDIISNVVSIITGLIDIIGGLADIIVGVLTGDMELAGQGFKRIWDGIKNVVSGAIGTIKSLVSGFVDAIKGFFLGLKNALIGDPIVIDMWNGITRVFSEGIKKIVDFVKGLVEKVVTFFTTLKDKITTLSNTIKTNASEKFSAMKTAVSDKVSQLKTAVSDKFTEIKNKIADKTKEAAQKAKEKFNELKNSVKEKLLETVNIAKEKATALVDKFKNINLFDIGKNIINGLLNGLKRAWESVKTWVSDACQTIKDKFTDAMKMGSPSKVFFKYGTWIDEGLVNGLTKGLPSINDAIDNMNSTVESNFNASVNTPTTGASHSTTINLNGDYMFQDKASMDYFLNRMQLAIQRV